MDDLFVVIVAVVVLFGGSQLPKLARNSGEALREFRKAHAGSDESTNPVVTSPAPVPELLTSTAANMTSTAGQVEPAASERLTFTRAELDALLAARSAPGRTGDPATTRG
jgi:TatA/E family protein of Tat protein translocase